MGYPRMARIRQRFDAPRIDDIPAEIRRQFEKLGLGQTIRPGQTVAITAGSRGIANIALIIKSIVESLKSLGAVPFVVPAMGSHGGGTAEGQREILETYGITAEYTGAEIRSSMETVIVDRTPRGLPVHFDKHAAEADHVLVCGRVKPHTGFVGEIESGLHKMMLIGLGKHAGAKIYHRAILDYSFLEIIQAVAKSVLEKCNVVAGLAIIENARDETALLEAVAPGDFFDRERELLKIAKEWMPRLPIKRVDLLIVDEIGKDISGSGLDTNVVGRKFRDHAATDQDGVSCRRIFVRGLTEATHGNAVGIGIAEFTNQRTVEAIDPVATRINAVTGGHPAVAAVPIALPTDRESVDAALQCVGLVEPENARVIQIADTLHVEHLLVSESCLAELADREDVEIVSAPEPMAFDDSGNLLPVPRA